MKLPHLDQIIELQRGEAGQLWWAVADCGRRNTVRLCSRNASLRVESAGIVPALAALERVARRLKRVDERELSHVGVPRQKPVKFRLHVDELVAIMLYVVPTTWSGHVPLGKVQQKSLNLDHLIHFN
ncbi:hypothetical protein [Hymenobacter terricola]|uniref:hypothetical protein n=1 Tax=Hymenobacter terricola TaxID=2819236 RepID=UPI001B306FA1|nr:hypothetical protein [Hymenobacter terricola]